METNNENFSLCFACQGKCCKHSPGMFNPEDRTWEQFEQGIREGKFYVDQWDGDPRISCGLDYDEARKFARDHNFKYVSEVKFIRPMHKPGETWQRSMKLGPCCFLQENGCEFKFDDRPAECKELVPQPEGCRQSKKREIEVLKWLPFQNRLHDLVMEIRK